MKRPLLNKIPFQFLFVFLNTGLAISLFSFTTNKIPIRRIIHSEKFTQKVSKKITAKNNCYSFCSISPGVIAANLPIADCGSINPNITINTTSATGDGAITYQWQSSIDNLNFTDIISATNATYAYIGPGLTTTTYLRRVATSTTGAISCSDFSNTLTYTVNPIPTVASILPGGTTNVCVEDTKQLTNATPNGIWSTDNAAIASTSNTGLITGVAAGTLTLGIHYTVTNIYGCSKAANKTVHVNPKPATSLIYHN